MVERLITASEDRQSLLVAVLGLGGEGKTTTARQVAAALVETHGWTVVNATVRAQLREGWLEQLPSPDGFTLLLVDTADLMLSELSTLAGLLPPDLLGRLHVLVTSRHQDWSRAIGVWLKEKGAHPLRRGVLAVQEVDIGPFDASLAEGIAHLWRTHRIDLGLLRGVATDHEIALRLLEEARGVNGASLFASLLSVRMDRPMLLEHAEGILSGLLAHGDNGKVLGRTLAYLALAEAGGFGGVQPEVLASLEGYTDRDVWARVLNYLGEEAGIAVDGGSVRTRHESIAVALVECLARPEVAEALGLGDLADSYHDLVRSTCETGGRVFLGATFGPTVHCGPFLAKRLRRVLGDVLDEGHSHRIAIKAAQASLEQLNRADSVTDYCEALVAAGRIEEAVATFRRYWNDLPSREDFRESARGYLFSWAVAEGQSNPARSLWLVLLSISDHFPDVPISEERKPEEPLYRAKASLSGVGRALQLMSAAGTAGWRVQGLAAAATLGRPISQDERTQRNFDRHFRDASALGLKARPSKRESVRVLADVADQAYCRLGDHFLGSLARPPLSFTMLAASLGIAMEG